MKISLLLHSASQDQRAPREDEAFYGWMHGPAAGGDDGGESTAQAAGGKNRRLPKYSLRKESWGGIFVYGPTQAVYQTDDEAYCLLLRLKNGENLDKVRLSPGALNQEIIDEFENTLKQLGVV